MTEEKKETMLVWWWIVPAVLFPVVGAVAGIVGLATKKEGSWGLLGITVGAWLFWLTMYI